MTVVTTKYKRKPLYVDAVRVTADNLEEIAEWCEGRIEHDETRGRQYIKVPVYSPKVPRQTMAFPGDWILYTERGGHKVYTKNAFAAAFDEVTQDESSDDQVVEEDKAAA